MSVSRADSDLSRKAVLQRVKPRITDFCYLQLRSNRRTFAEFCNLVAERGGNTPPLVLDMGCGFKPWTGVLAEAASARCVGVDYSRQAASPDAVASVDALPFPDSSFDAIVLSEVLEHTVYPDAVIAEARRVCRTGGAVFVSTPFAFPEHGAPYDFRRFTKYYFMRHFGTDEVVTLRPGSSTLATAFSAFSMFIESTPLRLAWGFKHVAIAAFNLCALASDAFIDLLGPVCMRTYRDYSHLMPIGYSLVVRVKK